MSSLIELTDIHFAYPACPPVLKGASLRLDGKERVCVVGHNGAGKSTLLHIVVGLLRPSRGRVVAFGQERRIEADFLAVRRLAGLVFQDPDDQLFCPTVAEDVAFGPLNLGKSKDEAMDIVDRVLSSLDLGGFRDRITHKLSGGEKRLVTLAAVLAMEPKVLLLDEPTNALDEDNEARLIEILLSLPQAMIVVSHDTQFRERIGSRAVRLADGEIVPG
ncbi:energy-coupling factor ABC transporter ATP-binding protein [Methyloceanibacter methanicus]|uniref:Energy-coupling factor ABC transporter ATP-binding protein n=1 Tax=Methyloceanibacter methanicus TaxID=1774968 RepID=A0A1E3VXA0_9HYPH|nr:ABC transporter ATP-binding protein [Methyloceanibacter methanicus]ODR97901.1 energy-coupling factor ABC transporter ATP-binding protein [Methyloceanibacter methanicus]